MDPGYDQNPYAKDTWNLYAYVGNNPVTHTDPNGMTESREEEQNQAMRVANNDYIDAHSTDGYSMSRFQFDSGIDGPPVDNYGRVQRYLKSQAGHSIHGQKGPSNGDFGRLLTANELSTVIQILCRNKNFKQYYDLAIANGYSFVSGYLDKDAIEQGYTDPVAKTVTIDTSTMMMGANGMPTMYALSAIISHEVRHVYQEVSLSESGHVLLGVYSNGKQRDAGIYHWESLNAYQYRWENMPLIGRSYDNRYVEKDAWLFASWIASEVGR